MSLKRFEQKGRLEAGCDEAGRGCLAGPVVAAAVILDPTKPIQALNDSKQLSEAQRESLFPMIKERALHWAIAEVSEREIEKINILNASILAMHRSLEKLSIDPEFILVDGNKFKPYGEIPHACIIKGDGKYQSIAAASILAKVHRDHLMVELDNLHPEYLWAKNKGYPTQQHRSAIAKLGATKHHRKTFRLLPEQLSLPLEGEN